MGDVIPYRSGEIYRGGIRYTGPIRQFGIGSFGDVSMVTGIPGNKEFALKESSFADEFYLEAALDEWNMLHIISHPNIVKPISISPNDTYTTIRISMPVIKKTLGDFIDQ